MTTRLVRSCRHSRSTSICQCISSIIARQIARAATQSLVIVRATLAVILSPQAMIQVIMRVAGIRKCLTHNALLPSLKPQACNKLLDRMTKMESLVHLVDNEEVLACQELQISPADYVKSGKSTKLELYLHACSCTTSASQALIFILRPSNKLLRTRIRIMQAKMVKNLRKQILSKRKTILPRLRAKACTRQILT